VREVLRAHILQNGDWAVNTGKRAKVRFTRKPAISANGAAIWPIFREGGQVREPIWCCLCLADDVEYGRRLAPPLELLHSPPEIKEDQRWHCRFH